jgi:hypothetical protein
MLWATESDGMSLLYVKDGETLRPGDSIEVDLPDGKSVMLHLEKDTGLLSICCNNGGFGCDEETTQVFVRI